MECNKDEAARALEIAQRKLGAKDIEGARKFAAKAQQLYPPLEGLSQIMVIVDVFLAAERKIEGELDWYGILQLNDVKSEDSLVKKQYRKMALLLHPDKNKMIGAEGAFKLIVEAWGVLCDKTRRSIYDRIIDQKRRAREFKETQNRNFRNPAQNPKNPSWSRPQKRPQKSSPKRKAAAAPPEVFPNFRPTCRTETSDSAKVGTAGARTPDSSSQGKSISFWTVCFYCGMQYEYLRVYERQNLLCRNCQKPFIAVEAVPIPVNYSGVGGFSCSNVPMSFANNASMAVGGFTNEMKADGFSNAKFVRGGAFMGAKSGNYSSAAANVETNNVSSENVGESKEAQNIKNINDCKEDDECDGSTKRESGGAAFSGPSQTSSHAPSSPKSTSSAKDTLSYNGSDDPTVSYKKREVDHCCEYDLNSVEVKVEQSKKRKEQEKKPFSEFAYSSKPSSSCAPSSRKSTSANMTTSSSKDSLSHNGSDDPIVSYKKRKVDDCRENDSNSVEVKVEKSKKRKQQEKKTSSEFAYSSKPDKTPAKQAPPATKSVKDLLAEKAKKEILRSLSELKRNAEIAALAADKEAANEKVMGAGRQEEVLGKASCSAKETAKNQLKGQKRAKIANNDVQNKVENPPSDKNKYKVVEKAMKSEIAEKPGLQPESFIVPDSDFYNFDNDRTENCFQTNQVWATYDDENGLPLFYARIVRVLSLNPFKVQMNWLEPKLNKYQACGGFTVGKVFSCDKPNMFSHVMKWHKAPKCIFTIFPKKSDVWAVYKNWDSSWDEHTPAEIRQKYVIVEVLTDYTEEFGVGLASLVKVSGFKSVFQRKLLSQPGAECIVPKAELLRFSHQIPARRLTEEDALNVPEDCWELDPAATPIDMLTEGTAYAGENVAEAEESVAQAKEKATEPE